MDFKRKLGHGLSALFSSDEEIDREIEQMERENPESQNENPFSNQQDPFSPIDPILEVPKMDTDEEKTGQDDYTETTFERINTSNEDSVPRNESLDSNDIPSFGQEEDSSVIPLNHSVSDSSANNPEDHSEEASSVLSADPSYLSSDSDEDSTENGDVSENQLKNAQMIDIYQIEPDRQQPRKSFDSQPLSELAESIKQYGVIQPILVSKKEDYYQIISGERRYRAARMAGLDKIPAIISEAGEQEKMALALIENIQRQELNPMEEANAYRTLMMKYQMTQEEIAEKLNKSRSSIANLLRLQKLPESVQKSLSEGLISFGHAKVLMGLDDPIEQTRLALQVVSGNLSVRELEDLVKSGSSGSKKKNKSSKGTGKVQTFSHRLAEDRLKEKLSTKVCVNSGKRKGSISIEFYSQEDLERILTILGI